MATETKTTYRRPSSSRQLSLSSGVLTNPGDTIESTSITSNDAATPVKNVEGVRETADGGDRPRCGELLMDKIKKKLKELDPTLVLENRASVARDHLANERTFLSWLRTSLAFISIGVAVTQLFRLNTTRGGVEDKVGKPLGITFILLGIMFLGFGVMRYFHIQHILTTGYFPASRASVIIGTLLTLITLGGCLVVVLVVDAAPREGGRNS